MDSSAHIPPTKPCHNCRRNRLRCDKSYPHCNKCAVNGQECLGYGKLFRWTGAIASRGKLSGRTSAAADVSAATTEFSKYVVSSSNDTTPNSLSDYGSGSSEEHTSSNEGSPARLHDQLLHVAARGRQSRLGPHENSLLTPRALIDPLYQDTSTSYRRYLAYFNHRLCQDLVSLDIPSQNPFRTLIPLTNAHPLLQHIIVASSAAHLSNLLRVCPPITSPQDTALALLQSSANEASQAALRDALNAKHRALQLMKVALQDIDSVGADVVFAAAVFFVNMELIESGKNNWRPHLEGAGQIIKSLPTVGTSNQDLRDYMLSDCFTYFILSSAFRSCTLSDIPAGFQPSQMDHVLRRATANSYLCCPPEVLEILFTASQLSIVVVETTHDEDEVTESGLELLFRARALNVHEWAYDVHKIPYLSQIPVQSRIHAGFAHMLATCLYILQALPSVGTKAGHDVAQSLSQDIFEHLSSIPDEDPNFKATAWPTFVAGAEAKDPERRIWVLRRLQKLVTLCPWGFIFTAMDTLPAIWASEESGTERRSWVQRLRDPDMNFLIV